MMKRWMFLVAVLASFLLSSCVYEPGPMGPVGPQGPAGPGMNWSVNWFTVNETDWNIVYPTGDTYFEYVITGGAVKDLDEFVASEGTVEMYIYTQPDKIYQDDKGALHGQQAPLPCTRYFTQNGKEVEMTYDFEYVAGKIYVACSYSDFARIAPPTVTFRIVLQW